MTKQFLSRNEGRTRSLTEKSRLSPQFFLLLVVLQSEIHLLVTLTQPLTQACETLVNRESEKEEAKKTFGEQRQREEGVHT